MFQRYKDYIPLSRYENGDPSERAHRAGSSRTHEKSWRQRLPVLTFYAVSLGINLFFIYKTFSAWPAPLDNYQAL